jgi:hypothetical protein
MSATGTGTGTGTGTARRSMPLTRNGDPCIRWDMRRDVPPRNLSDIEERLRPDPVRPLAAPPPPDPEAWAAGLARGVVEILSGLRPLDQLRRWVVPDLYEFLEALLPAGRDTRVRAGSCRVLSARACALRAGAVEVSVVVQSGPRTRAVAVRLEEFRGRWLTTALDVA